MNFCVNCKWSTVPPRFCARPERLDLVTGEPNYYCNWERSPNGFFNKNCGRSGRYYEEREVKDESDR